MANDESKAGPPARPGIVDDITVTVQQWTECFIAFGSAQGVIGLCIERMRAAGTKAERDSIEREVFGFLRRLSLGMLAIALPGDDPIEAKETPIHDQDDL